MPFGRESSTKSRLLAEFVMYADPNLLAVFALGDANRPILIDKSPRPVILLRLQFLAAGAARSWPTIQDDKSYAAPGLRPLPRPRTRLEGGPQLNRLYERLLSTPR
jgi:hypothetical protein